MKKQSRKVLLGAATMAALIAAGDKAHAATDALSMTAKIIKALNITASQNLNFGTLTQVSSGTLTIDKTGAVTGTTGGVSALGTASKEGKFVVKAAKNINFEVTLPATAKLANGGSKVTAKSFLISSVVAKAATPFVAKVTTGTTRKFPVSATLNVPAASATGTYKGTVTLTAVYQ